VRLLENERVLHATEMYVCLLMSGASALVELIGANRMKIGRLPAER
jgi:hypothetical protein